MSQTDLLGRCLILLHIRLAEKRYHCEAGQDSGIQLRHSCRPVVALLSFRELSARLLGKLVRRVGSSHLVAAKVKRRQGPITRALPFPAQISHYMMPLASCTDGRHECECKAVARTREC
jgi:hypothetical protein